MPKDTSHITAHESRIRLEKAQQVASALKTTNLPIRDLILYGSAARNEALTRSSKTKFPSDVDIRVIYEDQTDTADLAAGIEDALRTNGIQQGLVPELDIQWTNETLFRFHNDNPLIQQIKKEGISLW